MLQIQRWLSNWFAEWFSPECLPWILKLHSLHSFSHFNWQLNHSFRSSRASWLLNRFGKALYLVGRLAPGLVNARRSRPTNTAFRIRIRIRIVSALISWLLSISHLAEPPSLASIQLNPFEMCVRLVQADGFYVAKTLPESTVGYLSAVPALAERQRNWILPEKATHPRKIPGAPVPDPDGVERLL